MPSGTIWGSFSGKSTSIARPYINWSYTQDTVNNQSTVTATLYFVRYDGYRTYDNDGQTFTVTIDGTPKSQNCPFSMGPNGAADNLMTHSKTVTHDSEGNKSVTITATGNTGLVGTISLSATITLTDIPRASDFTAFTLSNTVLNTSTATTINYTLGRKSTSFSQDMTLKLGSSVIASWNTTGTGALTRTLSATEVNSILTKVPNSTSGTLTLTMQTKSGSTNVGSAKSINEGFSLNSAIAPTASGLTASIYGTGRDKTLNKYVQNISKVTASFTANAGYGATESSHTIIVRRQSDDANSQTITGESGTTANVVTLSGVYEIIATAKDSRGRTATQTITITVDAYSAPSISKFTTVRSSTTTSTVNASINSSWSPLGTSNPASVSIVGKNNIGTNQTLYTLTNSTATGLNTTQAYTGQSDASSFTYTMTITDSFGKQATAVATVGTSFVELTISKGLGIGIGKVHERGALDVKGNVYIDGGLELRGVSTTPYIDFSNDITIDYDMRLILLDNDTLEVQGGHLAVDGNNQLSFSSHGGGWYMQDSTWVRTVGSKSIYTGTGIIRSDGSLQVGNGGANFNATTGGTTIGANLRVVKESNSIDIEGTSTSYIGLYPKGAATRRTWMGYGSTSVTELKLYSLDDIVLQPNAGSNVFKFDQVTNGGLNFGASKLKMLSGSATLQSRNSADTAYAPMGASSFDVNSVRESKTNIKDFEGSALELVKSTVVHNYQLKSEFDIYEGDVLIGKRSPTEVKIRTGLIWDEAPEILRGDDSIDMYAQVNVLWKSVQELSEYVEFLDQKIKNR